MKAIPFNQLDDILNESNRHGPGKSVRSVYLLYGEEYLCTSALDKILDHLLPAQRRHLSYEPVDSHREDIADLVARLNTFSLLSEQKVLALIDSNLFHSKRNETNILAKAKEAVLGQQFSKAAGYLTSLLLLHDLSFDDIEDPEGLTRLKLEEHVTEPPPWLRDLIAYCKEKAITIPKKQNGRDLLKQAIENGFAPQNHLIITTAVVDKRSSLFKTIQAKGVVIDCTVPKGNRRADRSARLAALKEIAGGILAQRKKRMPAAAFQALIEKSGENLRAFAGNLEKLADYSGQRAEITPADVESVLATTKKDPIYELTNAVAAKDAGNALKFVATLLSGGDIEHPLQLLAAIANQVRKLLLVREFLDGPSGNLWRANMSYPEFSRGVMPAIQAHDQQLLATLAEWDTMLARTPNGKAPKKIDSNSPKSLKPPKTDLLIAKIPQNSYPVFLLMQKANRFSKEDLIAAMALLANADREMKRAGHAPRLVLEQLILKICQ